MPDEASRSPESSSRGGGGLALVVLLMFALLPVLYVLSAGPAEYLASNDYIDRDAVRPIYWPLAWLYQSFESIRPILDWYLEWWE